MDPLPSQRTRQPRPRYAVLLLAAVLLSPRARPRNRALTQALRPGGRVPAKATVVTEPGPVYTTEPGAVDGAPHCMDRQAVPTLGPPSSGGLAKLPLGRASKAHRDAVCERARAHVHEPAIVGLSFCMAVRPLGRPS